MPPYFGIVITKRFCRNDNPLHLIALPQFFYDKLSLGKASKITQFTKNYDNGYN
ncbi:hypothetical protein EDB48_103432 [Vibrio crassostreae]|nr:hypothetical protein EDB48_103432 [Vibrio crassostreae]